MFKPKRGMAALVIVIIISASILTMSLSAAFLGLGELDMGYTSQKGSEALAIADGCMEEALRRFRLDVNYNGDTLNLWSGSCTISIATSGSDRTITVEASLGDFNKKIQSSLTLSGNQIVINWWQEKDD